MSNAIDNARGIDLNSASEQDLERVGGLGRERAQRIGRVPRRLLASSLGASA